MKKEIINLIKSPFVKNVYIMATGAAGAQLVAMILSPIITRLYGPENFGVLGTFNSIINIIMPIAALTYPIAIVLPKKNQEAKDLVLLSLKITAIITVLSFVGIALFNSKIIEIFNLEDISKFLYLIPLVVVFSGIMQVTEQWLIRTNQFSINASVTFLNSIITNVGKVGMGLFYPLASVLVIITALGNGLRAFMMLIFIKKSPFTLVKQLLRRRKVNLRSLAKRYYDFPVYRAPEVFLSALSQGLPVLVLTAFFGSASAGFYTIGRTVLSIPSRLIGKAIGDVFYPRIANAANNNENVTKIIIKATLALSGIGLLPFGIIILFGPELFSFIFGKDWIIAGEYARWISLWAFSSFINRPSVHSLPVLNAQKFHLFFTIVMLITRLVLLAAGFLIFSSDTVAIALFGLSGAILNLILIFITLKMSKRKKEFKLR